MKQLTQKLKSGKMQVLEVPMPDLRMGMVLVRNYYSLISAGTEGSTVKAARKGYIGKAKERPQQVKQVIDTLKTQGLVQTYRAVMKKLDAHSPLGYSCVGEVIDIAPPVIYFRVGDWVACGGSTAIHAEVVAVPEQLCVRVAQSSKLEVESHLKMATYNTLGAIALQGVRQADLRLGETCAVIGMGLLGQLTAVLLSASGVKVIGIDINQELVELGRNHCLDIALVRDDPGIESKIQEFTNGVGCDAVIITAASSTLDPVNFAGSISRKKGTVVVVGNVPTGFDREPHFYNKELTVKMSCSYGPGRYDPEYEDKGHDYPVGYVRWTENRNMKAFQELISQGKIDISYLTTHIFKPEDAPAAYDMILKKSEPYIGILIEYDTNKKIEKSKVITHFKPSAFSIQPSAVTIGFIGAGSYAQSYLLPHIPKGQNVVLKGVMTSTSASSRSVADRYGFEFCTGNADNIIANDEINTVFIATRHDSHGYYVKNALQAGMNVFVEKPLCLTNEELEEIKLAADPRRQTQTFPPDNSSGGKGSSLARNAKYSAETNSNGNTNLQINDSQITSNGSPLLMVGYNRRFSPLTKILKDRLDAVPISMIYRINASAIPGDSWIQDSQIGGGRIVGEVCHFVDYLTYMIGSLPVSVYAAAMSDAQGHDDTLTISLKYRNGSIGSIQYFANGSKSLAKEYVEIYSHGTTMLLKDFRELEIYGSKKSFRKKLLSQDKGQKNEVKAFINSILHSEPAIIPFKEIFSTTETTFKILESIKTGNEIKID